MFVAGWLVPADETLTRSHLFDCCGESIARYCVMGKENDGEEEVNGHKTQKEKKKATKRGKTKKGCGFFIFKNDHFLSLRLKTPSVMGFLFTSFRVFKSTNIGTQRHTITV